MELEFRLKDARFDLVGNDWQGSLQFWTKVGLNFNFIQKMHTHSLCIHLRLELLGSSPAQPALEGKGAVKNHSNALSRLPFPCPKWEDFCCSFILMAKA